MSRIFFFELRNNLQYHACICTPILFSGSSNCALIIGLYAVAKRPVVLLSLVVVPVVHQCPHPLNTPPLESQIISPTCYKIQGKFCSWKNRNGFRTVKRVPIFCLVLRLHSTVIRTPSSLPFVPSSFRNDTLCYRTAHLTAATPICRWH